MATVEKEIRREHYFEPAEDREILDGWLRMLPTGTAQAVRLFPRKLRDGETIWLLGESESDVMEIPYTKGTDAKLLALLVSAQNAAENQRFAIKLVGSPPGVVRRLPVVVVGGNPVIG